jgi:hypothetical protein
LIPLNNVFGPFLTEWRERSRDRLIVFANRYVLCVSWTLLRLNNRCSHLDVFFSALVKESWKPLADGLEEDDSVDEKTKALLLHAGGGSVSINSETLHSRSVLDLFVMFTEAIRFLLSFSTSTQKQNVNLFVSRTFLHVAEAYTNTIKIGFLKQLQQAEETAGNFLPLTVLVLLLLLRPC